MIKRKVTGNGNVLKNKTHLILDMNGTFMFGHDRFAQDMDFYATYCQCNGELSANQVNRLTRAAYAYLDKRYPDPAYRECFPSVAFAIQQSISMLNEEPLESAEIDRLVDVFAVHELGDISPEFRSALFKLHDRFNLSLFIDIWAPKQKWLARFDHYGLTPLFSAMSFSSDLAIVKPSPLPLEKLVSNLGIEKSNCLVIGDSAKRDLGSAIAAQIDCILVGEENHEHALAHFKNLLVFTQYCT